MQCHAAILTSSCLEAGEVTEKTVFRVPVIQPAGSGKYFMVEIYDGEQNPVKDIEFNYSVDMGEIHTATTDKEGILKVRYVEPPGEISLSLETFTTLSASDKRLLMRLHDHMAEPMTNVSYRLAIGGKKSKGFSIDGRIIVEYRSNVCQECQIEWGPKNADDLYPYKMDVVLDCANGNEKQQATGKLHNIGYLMDNPYEENVRAFQADYEVGESGLATDSTLPPKTKNRLWSIYDERCNASRKQVNG
jgi:hypothetical protein